MFINKILRMINGGNLMKAAIALAVWFFSIFLAFEFVKSETSYAFLKQGGLGSGLFFVAFVAALDFAAFLPTTPILILSAGWFGFWPAFFYTLTGRMAGAVLNYQLSRRFGNRFAAKIIGQSNTGLLQKKLFYKANAAHLLWLRLLGPVSFGKISYLAGLTNLSFKEYFFTTLLGGGIFIWLAIYFGTVNAKIAVIASLVLAAALAAGYSLKFFLKRLSEGANNKRASS